MDRYPLKLIFEGKGAATGLDLYDGSCSFHGFAQAIQMAINAYRTGKPSAWSTSMKGAQAAFSSPRRGSVIFDIEARFETPAKDAPRSSSAFYDFLRVAFRRATGALDEAAETSYVERKLNDDETFFDDLSEKMEGALQRAHRTIDNDLVVVSLAWPRAGLVIFDRKTSEWVNTREEDEEEKRFTGNVTRYNTKTGNGRAYIEQVNKIVPIRQGTTLSRKDLLTWSLHGDNIQSKKKLEFFGRRVDSARGDLKRLILTDCNRLEK